MRGSLIARPLALRARLRSEPRPSGAPRGAVFARYASAFMRRCTKCTACTASRPQDSGGECRAAGYRPILLRNAAQGDCCLTFREIGVCGDTVEQLFGCKLDSGAKQSHASCTSTTQIRDRSGRFVPAPEVPCVTDPVAGMLSTRGGPPPARMLAPGTEDRRLRRTHAE